MIKVFAIILSLAVFGYLANDYIATNQQSSATAADLRDVASVKPSRIAKQKLEIEAHWENEKAARLAKIKNKNNPKAVKVTDTKKKLMIGEQAYILYGIFDNPEQPFVLLKDESGKLIKLKKGDNLSDEATLVALHSDNIAFERKNERIEFKLFERKQ